MVYMRFWALFRAQAVIQHIQIMHKIAIHYIQVWQLVPYIPYKYASLHHGREARRVFKERFPVH